MRVHNIHFYAELTKIIPYYMYHQIFPLILSSGTLLELPHFLKIFFGYMMGFFFAFPKNLKDLDLSY